MGYAKQLENDATRDDIEIIDDIDDTLLDTINEEKDD